jgi:hypothetical protein
MSKIRVTPRISVNKLGEYMSANALRRKRIVHDQMKPLDFIVPRYTPAEGAIVDSLVDSSRRDEIIYRQIERLYTTNISRKWHSERNRLCIEALESVLNITDEIRLKGVEFRKADMSCQTKLHIGGVAVSVRPEVLLDGRNRNGDLVHGAAKLYFCKSLPLNETSGEYIATLVHQYALQHMTDIAERKLCFVVDVFGQRIFHAPRARVRRHSEIEAAMEEYARAWKDLYNQLVR